MSAYMPRAVKLTGCEKQRPDSEADNKQGDGEEYHFIGDVQVFGCAM